MAETSKNKIYYNDNEDSIADVLEDMKKLAESTDNAIEKAKYNDTELKNKNTTQDSLIEALQTKVVNLEAENTSLKNQIPSGEATGNPIHLTDSSDMECEIVPIGGREQETRSGSNILNFNVTQDSRVTVNDDGTLTINGTGGFPLNISQITLKSGVTYYEKFELVSGTISNTNSIFMGFSGSNWIASSTFTSHTPDEDIDKSSIWINASAVFENAVIKLWANTDKSNFEPYGASPSPEYPSPVKTVGQNVNELANLIQTQIINGVEITKNNDGSLTLNGTATRGITINLNNESGKYFNAISGSSYTISLQNNSGLYFRLRKVSEDTNIATFDSPSKGITFTSNYTGECFAYLVIIKDTTFDNLTIYPKLEKGTVATPYSPYGQGSVEIDVVNKNLFDGIMEQGNISGTTGSNVTESVCIRSKNYIKIRPSKSYFFEREGKLTDAIGLRFYDKDKNIISSATTTIGYGVKNKIFTTVANAYYMRFTDWTNDLTNKYLLAQSNVATDYIPHESYTKVLPIQKEFVKIGDYEDTFVKVDGKWYEKHSAWKKIFDGTENWALVTETTDMIKVRAYVLSNPKTDNQGICNYFKVQAEATSQTNGGGISIYVNNNAVYVWVPKTIASTVDELKSKLAEWNNNGTPMELYYPLATPELIECTAEQEEILNSFYTYKGITNISVDGIATLKVNYKKDLETLINNIATSVAE